MLFQSAELFRQIKIYADCVAVGRFACESRNCDIDKSERVNGFGRSPTRQINREKGWGQMALGWKDKWWKGTCEIHKLQELPVSDIRSKQSSHHERCNIQDLLSQYVQFMYMHRCGWSAVYNLHVISKRWALPTDQDICRLCSCWAILLVRAGTQQRYR